MGASKKGKIYDYWLKQIEHQKAIERIGNARSYKACLHILEKYDKKIKERLFSEIDLKYVNALNTALIKNGCCGNTRFGYIKAVRLMWNKAMKDNEAPQDVYPFGKGGFSVNSLKEETRKRYLTDEDLMLIKESPQQNPALEYSRRLFLFSYYCLGMSFQDMAYLTTRNIEKFDGGYHIVYKRRKLKNQKEAKNLKVLITDDVKEMLEWFKKNTILTGDYILPIVTINHERGKLYNHVLARSRRLNLNLAKLGEVLGIKELTSYVARHTMAMVLQRKSVPREVINEMLRVTPAKPSNEVQSSNRPEKQLNNYPEVFGIDVCCAITGYKKNTIYKLTANNEIPYFRPGNNGRKLMFRLEEILEWTTARRQKTTEEFINSMDERLATRK